MIDISTYRIRIGTFSQKIRNRKSGFINRFDSKYQDKSGEHFLSFLQVIFKVTLIISLLPFWYNDETVSLLLGGAGEDVGGSLQGGAHGQLHGYGNMLMSSIVYEQVLSIAYRGARGGHQLAGSRQLLYGAGQVQLGHPHIVLGR